MVIVTFPNRKTQESALGFLLGRFSGKVLKSGEHIIPEAALEALAQEGFVFTVRGIATHEKQVETIRGAAASPVQRRKLRADGVARTSRK